MINKLRLAGNFVTDVAFTAFKKVVFVAVVAGATAAVVTTTIVFLGYKIVS